MNSSQLNLSSLMTALDPDSQPDESNGRILDYKPKGKPDQERRREEQLARQKQARRDLASHARKLALEPQIEPKSDGATAEEHMEVVKSHSNGNAKRRQPKHDYSEQLMMPETLQERPANLAGGWYAVPVPVGKRCLVISARGQTTARLRNGSVFSRFSSALPCGSKGDFKPSHYCILDCIYYEQTMTFYVLDMMCWRGYSLYDCTTDFRFYWLSTKLGETNAHVRSESNPYIFTPFSFYEADQAGLTAALHTPTPYEKGYLVLYSKETCYVFGTTPLMCVLEAKDAPKLLEYNNSATMQ